MARKIKTTVVGSYPVPSWLVGNTSRLVLRDAVMAVMKTQELAGLDLVTDGELMRFDPSHPETNGMVDYFVSQMDEIKKRGSIGKAMGMIPGMGDLTKAVNTNVSDVERQMAHMRAIYESMTREERREPDLLERGRRRRISAGADVAVQEVGQFIKQFESARDMMRAVGGRGRI